MVINFNTRARVLKKMYFKKVSDKKNENSHNRFFTHKIIFLFRIDIQNSIL